ncbi:hypothetical protein OROMI_018665 [Orobanche minor]
MYIVVLASLQFQGFGVGHLRDTKTKGLLISNLHYGVFDEDIEKKKKQEVFELQAGLADADVLIRKMDLQARSLSPGMKATLLARLPKYKFDVNRLKRELSVQVALLEQ